MLDNAYIFFSVTKFRVERAGEEEFYFDDIETSQQLKTQQQQYQSSKSPKLSSSAITIPGQFTDMKEPTNTNWSNQQHLLSSDGNRINSKPVSVIKQVIPVIQPTLGIQPFTDNRNYLEIAPSIIQKEIKQKRRKHSIGKKKCRKVYGMSNKDLWCTQCRWKKACARFL